MLVDETWGGAGSGSGVRYSAQHIPLSPPTRHTQATRKPQAHLHQPRPHLRLTSVEPAGLQHFQLQLRLSTYICRKVLDIAHTTHVPNPAGFEANPPPAHSIAHCSPFPLPKFPFSLVSHFLHSIQTAFAIPNGHLKPVQSWRVFRWLQIS